MCSLLLSDQDFFKKIAADFLLISVQFLIFHPVCSSWVVPLDFIWLWSAFLRCPIVFRSVNYWWQIVYFQLLYANLSTWFENNKYFKKLRISFQRIKPINVTHEEVKSWDTNCRILNKLFCISFAFGQGSEKDIIVLQDVLQVFVLLASSIHSL